MIAFGAFAGAGVVFLHKDNIRRLWRGEESRFHLRRKRSSDPSPSASL